MFGRISERTQPLAWALISLLPLKSEYGIVSLMASCRVVQAQSRITAHSGFSHDPYPGPRPGRPLPGNSSTVKHWLVCWPPGYEMCRTPPRQKSGVPARAGMDIPELRRKMYSWRRQVGFNGTSKHATHGRNHFKGPLKTQVLWVR